MARRKGRIVAFQALYSWEMSKSPLLELLDLAWIDCETRKKLKEDDIAFIHLLISGTIENLTQIDEKIRTHLKNWDFSRVSRVDLAILRISVYPLMFQKDIHPTIVIDEAVAISKVFGSDESYKFINAVLDSIFQSL